MTHPSTNRYSYTEVLERTVIIFKKHLKEIAILSTITYSLVSSFTLISGNVSPLIYNIFTLILIVYLFNIFQRYEDKKIVDLDRLIFSRKPLHSLIRLIKPFLLTTFFLILLSFALIIPALIFGIFWSFWEIIALEKDLKTKEILEYSKRLVSGNWWYIFIYFVITVFVSSLPSAIIQSINPQNPVIILLSNLISGFVVSFFIIGFFIIYRNLQKISH